MTRHAAPPPRGLLRTNPVNGEHQRWQPNADLADVIEHFWFVRWDHSTLPAAEVSILPHPSVHIVFEHGCAAEIAGVHRHRFVRTLVGRGQVFGIKFRPAGFFPFYGRAQNAFCDRRFPLHAVWPDSANEFEQSIQNAHDGVTQMQIAEQFLRACHTIEDEQWRTVRDVIEIARSDHQLLTVEHLAEHATCSMRQLQRLFSRYVGVSPKWIIQRYRLHEALASIEQSSLHEWVALALRLGYTDQAHFIRDFRASTGVSPAAYCKRATAPS